MTPRRDLIITQCKRWNQLTQTIGKWRNFAVRKTLDIVKLSVLFATTLALSETKARPTTLSENVGDIPTKSSALYTSP